jgi:hypothetical protein
LVDKHVKLAEEHNGKDRWGWRFVGCGSWTGRGEVISDHGSGDCGGQRKDLKKGLGGRGSSASTTGLSTKETGLPEDLTWVKKDLTDSYSAWTSAKNTAQVHPYLFTTSMLEMAKDKGVRIIEGKATSIEQLDGRTTGVTYVSGKNKDKETISATAVVLCAGAWSDKLPGINLPISAARAHSITIRPPASATITPYALFTEITLPSSRYGTVVEPEIYARPNNEVYACGAGDNTPLPESVDDVVVDENKCNDIWQHVASISQQLRDGTVEKRQACFLPVIAVSRRTPGQRATKTIQCPVIGEVRTFAKGLFIATGHTCWVRTFI